MRIPVVALALLIAFSGYPGTTLAEGPKARSWHKPHRELTYTPDYTQVPTTYDILTENRCADATKEWYRRKELMKEPAYQTSILMEYRRCLKKHGWLESKRHDT